MNPSPAARLLGRLFGRGPSRAGAPAPAAAPPAPAPRSSVENDPATWTNPPLGVASSNLDTVAYDWKLARLRIRFKSGGTYDYLGVPYDFYSRLLGAQSKGKFFHKMIKGKFLFNKVR